MVDLHTHSSRSDGTFSPTELIQAAKREGLSAIALTDHDILAGLDEAAEEAKKQDIIFLRGIEISINWKPGEFHMLGLDLRSESPKMTKMIEKLQNGRIERNMEIAYKLQQEGFDISYEKVKDFSKASSIGRPHFAAYMYAHKMVKKQQLAFDKYLGMNRPCYVRMKNVDMGEAIAAVKESGGVPVIAHPMSLYLSWSILPKMISDFQKQGLMGLEAYNASTREGPCRRLEALGKELGMVMTAGSDFHGKNRKGRRLGYTAGNLQIQDRFYESLRSVHPDLPEIKKSSSNKA